MEVLAEEERKEQEKILKEFNARKLLKLEEECY